MADDIINLGSYVCGIGTTPLPTNDPDLDNSSITAYASRPGIVVRWSYPTLNPGMVAHTDVYRSTGSSGGSTTGEEYTVSSLSSGGDPSKIWVYLSGLTQNFAGGFDGPVPGYEIGDQITVGSTEDSDWGFQATITGFFNYGTGIKTSKDEDLALLLNQPGGLYVRNYEEDFSQSPNFLVRVSADNYTDQLEENQKGKRFFYWVKHTSVNGTEGPLIGPASAVWNGTLDDILEMLQGMITDSRLDQDLRDRISRITDLTSGLSEEEQERLLGDNYLTQMIGDLTRDLEAIDTVVGSSILEIRNENQALALKVDVLLARWNANLAAVFDETYALAEADRATAGRITTVESALTNPDTGEMDIVTVQQQMITEITTSVNDQGETITDILGQWTVKIDVNGFISGVGLMSDGNTSEFIINANIFAIGAPEDPDNPGAAAAAARPFIVYQDPDDPNNSLVSLNTDVFIKNGTIRNAMIDNIIQSSNWSWNAGNFVGWQIDKNGNAWFDNITARGDIEATSMKANTVNVIDTLMIQDNAVTIPEGVHIPYGGGIGGREDIDPQIKNLATITMIWGTNGVSPQAFIVNAIYMALGTAIGQTNGARAGDGVISLFGEYGYCNPDGSQIHPAVRSVEYQSYAVSLPEGYGAMVTGLWHVVPPRDYYDWAHFTLRARTNPGQDSREINNAVMSILGAKK